MLLHIYTDGGARGNPGISGYGLVVYDDNHQILYQEKRFLGIKTNNEAEYSGFIAALAWLSQNLSRLSVSQLNFYSDSQLLIRQLQGLYKVKAPHLKPLFTAVTKQLQSLNLPYQFHEIPRQLNQVADELANQAMDSAS